MIPFFKTSPTFQFKNFFAYFSAFFSFPPRRRSLRQPVEYAIGGPTEPWLTQVQKTKACIERRVFTDSKNNFIEIFSSITKQLQTLFVTANMVPGRLWDHGIFEIHIVQFRKLPQFPFAQPCDALRQRDRWPRKSH